MFRIILLLMTFLYFSGNFFYGYVISYIPFLNGQQINLYQVLQKSTQMLKQNMSGSLLVPNVGEVFLTQSGTKSVSGSTINGYLLRAPYKVNHRYGDPLEIFLPLYEENATLQFITTNTNTGANFLFSSGNKYFFTKSELSSSGKIYENAFATSGLGYLTGYFQTGSIGENEIVSGDTYFSGLTFEYKNQITQSGSSFLNFGIDYDAITSKTQLTGSGQEKYKSIFLGKSYLYQINLNYQITTDSSCSLICMGSDIVGNTCKNQNWQIKKVTPSSNCPLGMGNNVSLLTKSGSIGIQSISCIRNETCNNTSSGSSIIFNLR